MSASQYAGFKLAGGVFIFLCVIRRHFLACEDIAGGSDLSAVGTFFHEIQRPFRWVPDVRWRNHYFARNKEAFPCVRPWTQLSASPCTAYFRWCRPLTMLTTPHRAHPRWWTTARPRTATSRRRRDVRGLTGSGAAWLGSRWRRTGGVDGWRDGLANGGVALHSEAC